MRIALVYDRVNKFGGAERVIQALHQIYPEAPLYTLVYNQESAEWAKGIVVIPTFLNSIPWFRKKHELLAPIASLAFETFDLSGFDVVISVTSSDAKSVITSSKQLHICYCLTPTRYFWSGGSEYGKDIKMRLLPRFIHNHLRTIDKLTSTRPDWYIAISKEVKKRIKKYYCRRSDIIYPSIEDKFYSKRIVPMSKRTYYLFVSRLVPYKKADLAVRTFNKLSKKLIVVGEGSEKKKLKSLAGRNISILDNVDDTTLINLYKNAKAVIFPQNEDFGLIPLEAQASGTPIIAYGKGGALETVIENKTGIFFSDQSVNSLIQAINKFEKMDFNPKDCVENAKKFSRDIFQSKIHNTVTNLWEEFDKKKL